MRGGADITGEEGRTGVGDQVSGSSWGDADTGGVGLEKHGRERLTGGGRTGMILCGRALQRGGGSGGEQSPTAP